MADPLDPLVDLSDALDRIDDFLAGVTSLASGRLGGEPNGSSSWLARRVAGAPRGFRLGAGSLAVRLAALHGPEQVRKAVVEAERAAQALARLARTTDHAALSERLVSIGVGEIADRLRDADPRSDRVLEQAEVVSRAMAILGEDRVRRALAARRREVG